MRGVPEYWIVDPQKQVVIVRSMPGVGGYAKSQEFCGAEQVRSQLPKLHDLRLTAEEILDPSI